MELRILQEERFDVLVVGAGTAGVFAAIAAANCGARVLLAERGSTLGGTVTASGVNFPGLFYAWGRQIIDGPCWHAITRTAAANGAVLPTPQYRPPRHWMEQIRLDPLVYTAVLWEMCREAGVTVRLFTMPCAVTETADGVRVLLAQKEGVTEIHASVAVDATGDANLIAAAGYAVERRAIPQPATLQVRMEGYALERVERGNFDRRFAEVGFAPHLTAEILWHALEKGQLDVHLPCADAEGSDGRTALEAAAYAQSLQIYRFFRSVPGLEGLTVRDVAAETGVRESCRVIGERTVTADAYLSGKHWDDAVCYAFYPIDLHEGRGIRQRFLEDDVVGEIPFGALIPRGATHLLCAGRCVSSDPQANSALRVQAPCMAMGQAAGCAAALAAEKTCAVRDVPYAALCQALRSIGAIVPDGAQSRADQHG